MNKEIWKDIPNYKGIYQASNYGRIKSIDRIDNLGRILKGQILKQKISPNGYLKVGLCKNGIAITKTVHSLILETFKGSRPKDYDSCHTDGIRTNNSLNNLRWDSRSANSLDAVKHGTCSGLKNNWTKGENHSNAKLTKKQVLEIKKYLSKSNLTQIQIGKIYGVSNGQISKIKYGLTWKHLQ